MKKIATKEFLDRLRQLKAEGYKQHEAAKIIGKSIESIRSICTRYGVIGWPAGAAARNQRGVLNPNYYGGKSRATRGRRTKEVLLNTNRELYKCERCGATRDIPWPRHHKDRDNTNHAADNIEVLCVSCHNKEHMPERTRTITGVFI